MLYSYIFTCYILVRMIDAADPEKSIFQKALLLASDQKKTLLLKQNHIKGHICLGKFVSLYPLQVAKRKKLKVSERSGLLLFVFNQRARPREWL